jgi:putative ABC transport system permease protein
MVPLAYNIRSLRERRRTTIATALGIALVVFVLSASMMLSRGIQAALGMSGRPDVVIVVRKGTDSEMGSTIPTENLAMILSGPGVRTIEGRPAGVGEVIVVAAIQRIGAADQVSNVMLRGVPENVFAFRPEVRIVEGRLPRAGTDEVVIGKRIRGRFVGVDLGQEFEIKKNRSAKVVGVFEAGGSSHESEVWVDIDILRNAFGRAGMISSARVQLESPGKLAAFEEAIEHDKRLGLVAHPEAKFLEMQSEGTSIFITALGTVVAFFFSIGAIIGAMITMFAAVSQRRREVGVLRALGFSKLSILVSFLFEAIVLSVFGGTIGVVASIAMGAVEFSTMNFATWSEMVFKFTPTPAVLGTSLFFAVVMGVVGGFLPAFQASRISPIEAMRG